MAARTQSPASEAWRLMAQLFGANKRSFFAIASEFELSPPQVMALRHLEPSEPRPMSELACALHCDNSNVTGIVDRLEDRGLVERHAAEHDRRVKMLVVTARGAELRARLSERLDTAPEALARLSEADQVALRDIMRRATEA
ncbi:MAG: MarR family transcriptional regulator [Actinomycetota bacterium]|nr:MarR family transcriptional regulator [Actinomycetota bacterium]